MSLAALRLALGDAAGAQAAAERAGALTPLFEAQPERRKFDVMWASYLEALARGARRDWPGCEAALRRAVDAGLYDTDLLRDPRLCEDRRTAVRPEVEAFRDKVKAAEDKQNR
jgi:hypothetical protein